MASYGFLWTLASYGFLWLPVASYGPDFPVWGLSLVSFSLTVVSGTKGIGTVTRGFPDLVVARKQRAANLRAQKKPWSPGGL